MPITRRLLAVAAAVLTLGAGSAAVHAQTVLRYSNWLPVGHPLRAQVIEPWVEQVAKVTQGRVKVEFQPKVVGTVPGQFDVLADGLADVSLFVPSYSPGKFDVTELMELAFVADKASVRSPATWRFYSKHLAKYDEYKGVQVLSVFTGPAQHFYTSKRTINSIDDIAGLKLRSPSPAVSQALTLLKAVPVVKPATEIYEMVSSGVLDGAVFTIPDNLSFKLTTVVPKAHIVPGGFSSTVIVLGANPAKWASLSKADQDAIMAVSGEALARQVGVSYDAAEKESLDATLKAGGSVQTMSPALVSAMKERVAPMEQAALEKARKKGIADPAALVTLLRGEIASGNK